MTRQASSSRLDSSKRGRSSSPVAGPSRLKQGTKKQRVEDSKHRALVSKYLTASSKVVKEANAGLTSKARDRGKGKEKEKVRPPPAYATVLTEPLGYSSLRLPRTLCRRWTRLSL